MSDFTLVIGEPLTATDRTLRVLDVIDINTRVTGLQWSNTAPMGHVGLVVSAGISNNVRRGYLTREIERRELAHVELRAGALTLWAGRVTDWLGVAGKAVGLRAIGYGDTGLKDGYSKSTNATVSTTGPVLRTILETAGVAPVITVGNPAQFGDPGIPHARVDFLNRAPADIAQQILKEGSSDGTVWDYFVWFDADIGPVFHLVPRTCPVDSAGNLVPDYYVAFDETVSDTRSAADMYGAASLQYTLSGDDTTHSATATVANFETTYGLLREAPLSGSMMPSADAAVGVINTYLRQHGAPVTAYRITRTFDQGLLLATGVEVPAYLAQAGQWVQLGEPGDLPPVCIVQVSVDAIAGTVSIDLDNLYPDMTRRTNRVSTVAGHVVQSTNPVTGAPNIPGR